MFFKKKNRWTYTIFTTPDNIELADRFLSETNLFSVTVDGGNTTIKGIDPDAIRVNMLKEIERCVEAFYKKSVLFISEAEYRIITNKLFSQKTEPCYFSLYKFGCFCFVDNYGINKIEISFVNQNTLDKKIIDFSIKSNKERMHAVIKVMGEKIEEHKAEVQSAIDKAFSELNV